MFHPLKYSRIAWLGIGLVGGLILGGMWPQTPLHAVATDRCRTFAMATGPVDEEVEAVYFLDFLTGDLNAVVLGRRGVMFTGFYHYPGNSLFNDLGVDPAKNPSYMMEVTTGKVGAYAIPWDRSVYATGRIMPPMPLQPLAATRFRAAAAVAPPG